MVRRHPGMVLGVARFYHDPRGSMRAMLESGPTEARLLAYAMIAAVFQLAGRVAQVVAGREGEADLTARVMEQTVSLLFFLPLVYYGLAAAGTVLARAFGGQGDWFLGRAAFLWAALVSAPVMLLSMLAGLVLTSAAPDVRPLAGQIGPIFLGWALAQTFAEAFGFRRAMVVLAVIAGIALGLLGIIWAAAGA